MQMERPESAETEGEEERHRRGEGRELQGEKRSRGTGGAAMTGPAL
jgi:hypothetical protein